MAGLNNTGTVIQYENNEKAVLQYKDLNLYPLAGVGRYLQKAMESQAHRASRNKEGQRSSRFQRPEDIQIKPY
jgi:hypothetical protein